MIVGEEALQGEAQLAEERRAARLQKAAQLREDGQHVLGHVLLDHLLEQLPLGGRGGARTTPARRA